VNNVDAHSELCQFAIPNRLAKGRRYFNNELVSLLLPMLPNHQLCGFKCNTQKKDGTQMPTRKTPQRDAAATRARILAAAKVEFAKNGLGGARVDVIAERAKINKRMLYLYFGNKEDLFGITLDDAYFDFRQAEAALELERYDPVEAVKRFVSFTWHYYLDNPEFITLVNSENLHKARHLKVSRKTPEMSRAFVNRMQKLLKRGQDAGVFLHGLDPVQVNITIAAIGYYYLTNKYTGTIVFERDLMDQKALEDRLQFNIKCILRMLCTTETLRSMGL
jgi:AcrR family transcriptional regulator